MILDFLGKHPRASAPSAWEEKKLTRRVRVLTLFVLCCKAALKRKIKFSEAGCTTGLHALAGAYRVLRSDDFYIPCSLDGIEQDCLTIGIALALRGTAYGNLLLSECLDRLKRLRINRAFRPEGVWLGNTYATHCSVLATLTGLFAGSFPSADAALIEAFHCRRKEDDGVRGGHAQEQRPAPRHRRKQGEVLRRAPLRRAQDDRACGRQADAGGKAAAPADRITDTYVFRENHYFISHSAQKVDPDSFAGGPACGRALDRTRGPRRRHAGLRLWRIRPAHPHRTGREGGRREAGKSEPDEFDPALRNGYRIDGEGNVPPDGDGAKSARMVKSWRGPGWAAAKSFESNYGRASV